MRRSNNAAQIAAAKKEFPSAIGNSVAAQSRIAACRAFRRVAWMLLSCPAQPFEVAPAYVFLASRGANFITGQFIHVIGGSFIG